MSVVRFTEHNGERIAIDNETHELRCDVCGEFIDRGDAFQVQVNIYGQGASLGQPLALDSHPHCAPLIGSRVGQAIADALVEVEP